MKRKVLSNSDVDLYERSGGTLEIFADGIHGMMFGDSVMKINFTTDLMHTDEGKRVREIACTMVLPANQVRNIAELLLRSLDEVEKGSHGRFEKK